MYAGEIGMVGEAAGGAIIPRFISANRIQRAIINPAAVWTNKDATIQLTRPPQPPQAAPAPPLPPGAGGLGGGGRHMRFFNNR